MHLVDNLAASIEHGKPPAATAEYGLASAVTCFAIDRDLDTGQVIDLTEDWQRIDQVTNTATRSAPGD